MKRILITAGAVYGVLDSMKVVSNRARGIWALSLAEHLGELHKDYKVTLLIPDTLQGWEEYRTKSTTILRHRGYHEYAALCEAEAPRHDAAIMAAAVTNFIPQFPVKGKMSTAGMKEGDVINIPFYLAPRVINRMKVWNPKLTLIGCKLLSGVPHEELVENAYHVLLDARCNAVVANDLSDLKTKHIVYQDRSAQTFDVRNPDFEDTLRAIIEDEHYRTSGVSFFGPEFLQQKDTRTQFDALVSANRERFIKRTSGADRVFGAVAIQIPSREPNPDPEQAHWLVSTREKDMDFTGADAVLVYGVNYHTHTVSASGKASLNATLLIRFGTKFGHRAVLHFHEQVPGLPVVEYAPPGTVRDNDREITDEMKDGFNIAGHGCVIPAPVQP